MAGFLYRIRVNKALMVLGISPDQDMPRGYKDQMQDLGSALHLSPQETALKIMNDMMVECPGVLIRSGVNTKRYSVLEKWRAEGKLDNIPEGLMDSGFGADDST